MWTNISNWLSTSNNSIIDNDFLKYKTFIDKTDIRDCSKITNKDTCNIECEYVPQQQTQQTQRFWSFKNNEPTYACVNRDKIKSSIDYFCNKQKQRQFDKKYYVELSNVMKMPYINNTKSGICNDLRYFYNIPQNIRDVILNKWDVTRNNIQFILHIMKNNKAFMDDLNKLTQDKISLLYSERLHIFMYKGLNASICFDTADNYIDMFKKYRKPVSKYVFKYGMEDKILYDMIDDLNSKYCSNTNLKKYCFHIQIEGRYESHGLAILSLNDNIFCVVQSLGAIFSAHAIFATRDQLLFGLKSLFFNISFPMLFFQNMLHKTTFNIFAKNGYNELINAINSRKTGIFEEFVVEVYEQKESPILLPDISNILNKSISEHLSDYLKETDYIHDEHRRVKNSQSYTIPDIGVEYKNHITKYSKHDHWKFYKNLPYEFEDFDDNMKPRKYFVSFI